MESEIDENSQGIKFVKGRNLNYEETIIDFRKLTGVEDESKN